MGESGESCHCLHIIFLLVYMFDRKSKRNFDFSLFNLIKNKFDYLRPIKPMKAVNIINKRITTPIIHTNSLGLA
jgi:hypothetical protein